uniref:F-box domain-containing protein n=1 Tax=Chenopodium quinoa TaxID=63459 RepID=A0A803M0H7_CHEQI
MGSGQSGLRSTGRIGLGDLPESCVAVILGQLSPPEICRLSEVNWAFYEASLSDFVWETKLPSNFEFLVRKLFDESPKRFSKREIFSRLSRSVRFDAGTKIPSDCVPKASMVVGGGRGIGVQFPC